MTTMIERVARALCDERTWTGAWTHANEVERNGWIRDARAAIAAMREPTQQMEVAGNVELIKRPGARHTYTAMIDTALEEGE